MLALFVKKPKLDTLGAVLDKIEKLWLQIHLVDSHKIIIADGGGVQTSGEIKRSP